ncbi:MAG: hypothetical protein GC165_01370 [Armatimonadetes bacterium]|nr:hypothetical protein [Armatimonadota bacterium]
MQTDAPPISEPKRRLSPMAIIMIAIFAVCALFLLFPSSKSVRERKALEEFRADYSPLSSEQLQMLRQTDFCVNGRVSKIDQNRQYFVRIFAPNPADASSTTIVNDLMSLTGFEPEMNPTLALAFAPAKTSAGWTLWSEVWIATCLQGKATAMLPQYGQRLLSSGTAGIASKELKKMWDAVPPSIQIQADEILERNRKLAASIGVHKCAFVDGNFAAYKLDDSTYYWQFSNEYTSAFPNRRVAE